MKNNAIFYTSKDKEEVVDIEKMIKDTGTKTGIFLMSKKGDKYKKIKNL